jgi:hypothetical protein
MTHDQNFKNLILDYPSDAIALFAGTEPAFLQGARITPVRQEQLQQRLGDRFRALDVPLLVEWPDGSRAAVLFVIEQETEPSRFSIHRLAHYCLDLSELLETTRIVPVVVFLHPGGFCNELVFSDDWIEHLRFHFRAYALPLIPAREHFDSQNLVARLNLPNMAYASDEKLEVYARAVRGLRDLEPDPERRFKYIDFIDIYAALDENEQELWRERYPEEVVEMTGFAERFIQQGIKQGREQGLELGLEQGLEQGIERGLEQGLQRGLAEGISRGEARVLGRQLTLKFGQIPDEKQQRINSADAETLLLWSERVLTANTLDEIFR